MKRFALWILAVMLCLTLPGCDSAQRHGGNSGDADPEESPLRSADVNAQAKHDGPAVTVRIAEAERSRITATLTAPTGGWRWVIDRAQPFENTLYLFTTLEEPAENELVTQALQEKSITATADPSISATVVLIREVQRGSDAGQRKYRIAARSE